VIVLANGGARTIAAAATDFHRVALIEPAVGDPAKQMGEAMTRFSRTPPSATSPLIDTSAARSALRAAFGQVWPGLANRDSSEPRDGNVT
jgi:hypothetical protein